MVDGPALAPEEAVQHPVAVTRPLAGELAQILAQLRILDVLALVAAGRARQLDDAAGATLADTEIRLEKTRSLAACGGGHHFFAFTAFSICTSRANSTLFLTDSVYSIGVRLPIEVKLLGELLAHGAQCTEGSR